jgi:uncharacterized OsmC-like protein
MMVLYARRHGWKLDGVRVDVSYDPDARQRQFETQVQLPPGLSAGQIRRLQRVAETCPVRRALESGFVFTERFNHDHPAYTATEAA